MNRSDSFHSTTVRVESNANEAELVYVKLKKTQHLDFQLKKNN